MFAPGSSGNPRFPNPGFYFPMEKNFTKNDGNTIFGASFDHKTETPGLGAEIREDFFEQAFIGKKICIKLILLKSK